MVDQTGAVRYRPLVTEDAPRVILDLLVESHPALVSIDELVLEIAGSAHEPRAARVFVEDGLAELMGRGLVHRLDRFVFASRTAVQSRALAI